MIKVERSYPAPVSLAIEKQKKKGKYDKEDVIKQLRKDFHDKCYICGLKELQDPQVEHLLPHKNGKYPDRKFNWDNLFWSCGHCNGVKNQKIYEESILDCCKVDPESLLKFRMKDDGVEVICEDSSNVQACATAKLCQEVFNIQNTGMRVYKSEIRFEKLTKEMNLLYGVLGEWKQDQKSKVVLRKLKALLRKESQFAEFKRCYVREHADDYEDILDFIA